MNDPNVLLKQKFIMFDFKTILPVFKETAVKTAKR